MKNEGELPTWLKLLGMTLTLFLLVFFAWSIASSVEELDELNARNKAACEERYNEPCWPLVSQPKFESDEARQAYIREWRERRVQEDAS
jgi:hypothetical protein